MSQKNLITKETIAPNPGLTNMFTGLTGCAVLSIRQQKSVSVCSITVVTWYSFGPLQINGLSYLKPGKIS